MNVKKTAEHESDHSVYVGHAEVVSCDVGAPVRHLFVQPFPSFRDDSSLSSGKVGDLCDHIFE